MGSSRFSLEAILSLVDNMTRPYRRTTNKVNALSKRMKNGFKAVARAAGRVAKVLAIGMVTAIAAVAVATVRMVNKMAEAGDEIGKTSRQLGIGVEAFQELTFAADRQGVSVDTLKGSLEKLNKNVGDLRAGTGSLRTILDATNPSLAEQLKNVENNEEAFNLLITEIGALPNQMDKAALAQAAFGRSGQDMLRLVEAGPEGLAALREEARSYGLMTEETTANSEAYIDALTNLKAVAKGVGFTIGADLIPQFTAVINTVKEFAMANQDLIATRIQEFIQIIGNVFNSIKPALVATVKVIMNIAKTVLPLLVGVLKLVGDTVLFLLPLVDAIVDLFVGLFAAIKESGQLDKLRETFQKTAEHLKPMRDTLVNIIATVKEFLIESNALTVIVSLFRVLGGVISVVAGAFRLMWSIVKPILNALMFLLKPILFVVSKIIDAMGVVTQGIGGVLGNIGGNRTARQEERQNRRQERRDERSGVEQQQVIVEQQRTQEDSQQRNAYDIYLHSAVAGAGISQDGSAPSTAVNLGGGQ